MTNTSAHIGTLSAADIAAIRMDFPLLGHGAPFVVDYLDSAATAQRPRQVLDAERVYLETMNSSAHRSAHSLAAESTMAFEDARETVANFFGVTAEEIAWQANATDAINTIAGGFALASEAWSGAESRIFALGPGDEILITQAEHHANLVPWQQLALRTGATLRWVEVNEHGTYSVEDVRAALSPRTRVFAFTHISNVTGFVAPIEDLVALAHSVGALVVLDACQSAPHRPLNFRELDVDFAVLSAHKMLGPTGVGVLYGKYDLLNRLPPAKTGGSMISLVSMEESTFLPSPQRFEAGTQPISQVVAFAEGIRYLENVGMDRIAAHETALGQRLADGVSRIPGVRLVGPPAGQPRAGLVSVDVAGVHAHDVGQFLDAHGIAVRVGHHCTQPLHRALSLTATTRASTYLYTTSEEVDHFIAELANVRAYFGVTT
jgi:cysteine desulfurase/selenocysteine lyase